jgi:hypothetical protein
MSCNAAAQTGVYESRHIEKSAAPCRQPRHIADEQIDGRSTFQRKTAFRRHVRYGFEHQFGCRTLLWIDETERRCLYVRAASEVHGFFMFFQLLITPTKRD